MELCDPIRHHVCVSSDERQPVYASLIRMTCTTKNNANRSIKETNTYVKRVVKQHRLISHASKAWLFIFVFGIFSCVRLFFGLPSRSFFLSLVLTMSESLVDSCVLMDLSLSPSSVSLCFVRFVLVPLIGLCSRNSLTTSLCSSTFRFISIEFIALLICAISVVRILLYCQLIHISSAAIPLCAYIPFNHVWSY